MGRRAARRRAEFHKSSTHFNEAHRRALAGVGDDAWAARCAGLATIPDT